MEYPISQLSKHHALSDEFIRDLGFRIRRLEAKKGNTLLLKGDICRDLFLIEKGIVACYDIDEDGNKYCSWIMQAGDYVTAVNSFNNQVTSTETIVALTDCILWVITKDDLEQLTEKHLEFKAIRQILTDQYHNQSREMDTKRKRPPEQFYEYLLTTYPDIVKGVTIGTLASLMGIARETLHKILRLRKNKN